MHRRFLILYFKRIREAESRKQGSVNMMLILSKFPKEKTTLFLSEFLERGVRRNCKYWVKWYVLVIPAM